MSHEISRCNRCHQFSLFEYTHNAYILNGEPAKITRIINEMKKKTCCTQLLANAATAAAGTGAAVAYAMESTIYSHVMPLKMQTSFNFTCECVCVCAEYEYRVSIESSDFNLF